MQNQIWLWKFLVASMGLWVLTGYNQIWSATENQENQVKVLEFNTEKLQDYLVLNFIADINLPLKLSEAVHNKIPLYLVTEIELRRKDNLLFIPYYVRHKQYEYTTLFSYSHFDKSYKLHNLRNNNQLEFTNLQDALQTFGNLNNFYLANSNQLYPGLEYQLRVRFSLNKKQLPVSLYTQTFFNQDWNFKTDWFTLEISAER